MTRVKLTLFCETCKTRNYFTSKNKKLNPTKITRRKYCSNCRQINQHTEKEL